LLVGIPGKQQLDNFVDVKVVDYGYRSITAILYPTNINKASREILESIPGVGKKRAIRILAKRPINDKKDLRNILDEPEIVEKILDFLSF
jgi:radical SAM superfamily enzyme with C-terminal helix-hairpin-helix motif